MRRIFFCHSWVHDVSSFLAYTKVHLDPSVELIWDDKAPEVLFGSDQIYVQKQSNSDFKRLYNKAKTTIYFGSEASFMDFNLFDYGIGFDNSLHTERHVQLPIERFYSNFLKHGSSFISMESAKKLWDSNLKFCNFLYSNRHAHPRRDELFYLISKYKRVDSLGKHMNNTGLGGTGFQGHRKESTTLKEGYKFSITCENACFPGYTSEKIYTSLMAKTVPIYWGNPDIEKEINPECFINCMIFDNDDKIIAKIKEIENDKDLWVKMITSPWHTLKQQEYIKQRSSRYDEFMNNILSGSSDNEYRRTGTFQNYYRSWFLNTGFKTNYMLLLRKHMAPFASFIRRIKQS